MGDGIERAACAPADQPQWCGVVCGDEGSEPRREGMIGPESSVPGLICSCSDFHCGTCARNRVSSGGKRRFPPRGADKDLINWRESWSFWPGAGTLTPVFLGDPAPLSRPHLPLPCHCGVPGPETSEGPWAPRASQLPWGPVSFEGGKGRKRPEDPDSLYNQHSLLMMPIIKTEQPKHKIIVSSSERALARKLMVPYTTSMAIGDCCNRGGGD